MRKTTHRRSFLTTSLKAAVGIGVLSSTTTPKVFANESRKNDFRIKSFQKYVEVKGKIFDKTGKLPLSNASIQVKFLSPDNKKLEISKNLVTDSQGNYAFLTNIPQREYGKHHKVHFKIASDSKEYSTEISFNNLGAYISSKHWEENVQLGNQLLFPKKESFLNKATINFNISFNN